MKNIILTIFMIGIASILITSCSLASTHVKVTVKVIDEDNIPVNDADVEIIFSKARPKPPGKGWGNTVDYHEIYGKTNTDGIFSASYTTNMGIPVLVSKTGFYNSSGGISLNESGKANKEIVKLVLKKKKNPVSMYAKGTGWIKVPAFDKSIGYDLEVGDWVTPYGKGKINDFVFTFSTKPHEISYVLSFSNNEDGIQEYKRQQDNQSSYKWPFDAPVTGYQNTLVRELKYIDRKMVTNLKKDVKYIYRVRTVIDEKGQIIKACYGKIPSKIDVTTDGYVRFGYYYNPDGTRNLEFDTDKNLFVPEGAKKYPLKYDKFIGFGP